MKCCCLCGTSAFLLGVWNFSPCQTGDFCGQPQDKAWALRLWGLPWQTPPTCCHRSQLEEGARPGPPLGRLQDTCAWFPLPFAHVPLSFADFALYLFTINPSCVPSLPSESSNMGALAQSPFPIPFSSFHLSPLSMLEYFNYLSCLLSSPHGRPPLPQSLRYPSITPHRPTKYPGRVWYVLNDNCNSFIAKAGFLGL